MKGITAAALSGLLVLSTTTCSDAGGPVTSGPDPVPSEAYGVIAFVSDRDGNPEIYSANANGTNLRRLTNDPANDTDPVWSPDGSRIAFVSSRAGAHSSDIYVMNADGSGVVRRTVVGQSYTPAWSPDGRKIAFSAYRESPDLHVYVMDVDGDWQNPRLVSPANDLGGGAPAWSPDGTKIAFTGGGDYTAGLFIVNADGSGLTPLRTWDGSGPPQYVIYARPTWSPDGSKIAVVACTPFPCLESSKLQVMNTDGSGVVTLRNVSNLTRLTWSPDARTIAFGDRCGGPSCSNSVDFIRADGSQSGVIMSNAYSPAWRPDPTALATPPVVSAPPGVLVSDPVTSSGIAFVSAASESFKTASLITLRNRTSGGSQVPAILANGGFDPVGLSARSGDDIQLTVVTNSGDLPISMTVKVPPRKPPGIVRTSPSKGRIDVALNVLIEVVFTEPVDRSTVNASSLRVLRNGTPIAGDVTLSSDGLTATFTPAAPLERLSTYTIDVTGAIRDLDGDALSDPTQVDFTTANPPPGVIAFVSDRDGNEEIYTANTDGTGVTRLTNNSARDYAPAWSPDGKRIAFASDRGGTTQIYEMNADGSNVVRRTNAGTWNENPAWSRDGSRIAYTGDGMIRVADAAGDWSQSSAYTADTLSVSVDPTWSPDGKKIAFASDNGVYDGQQLFVMSSDGKDVRVLLRTTADFSRYDVGEIYFQPSWSPDGTRIAVVACHFSPHNCYPYSTVSIINADGSGLRTLKYAGGEARPTWSPDGRFIAFASESCYVCPRSIRYARVDGGNEGITNDVLIVDGYSPAWKP